MRPERLIAQERVSIAWAQRFTASILNGCCSIGPVKELRTMDDRGQRVSGMEGISTELITNSDLVSGLWDVRWAAYLASQSPDSKEPLHDLLEPFFSV